MTVPTCHLACSVLSVFFFCSSGSEPLKASGYSAISATNSCSLPADDCIYRGACAVHFVSCTSWYANRFWGELSNNRAHNSKGTDIFFSNGILENAETLAKIFMFLSLL